MCGIAGYINLGGQYIRSTGNILKMLQVQKHRGPDDSGVRLFSLENGMSCESEAVTPLAVTGNYEGALGFNRLSVLDLSYNGHQPMISPDGNVIFTLNGEVYNAFSFKDELKKWGYAFKSTTDTEIVLALYLRYGFEGMLNRMNGMFAIVLADLSMKKVFIARDRFGIKPMYYAKTESVFAFSSELKSLGHTGNFRFQLAETQLDEYLIFRNNINDTLFKDIKTLQPGHYLIFNPNDGLQEKSFFDINIYSRTRDVILDYEGCLEKLEEWLGNSVKSQLVSDVKLGCQLSGGIDSSLVTLLANRMSSDGNLESVSVIFNDKRFSEEMYIDYVARHLGIVTHKFLLDPDYYLANIEKATWHLETPLNHQNTIGIFYLSQRAKEYVTVLLSGEGADEITGGYERFGELRNPYNLRLLLHQLKANYGKLSFFKNYADHEFRAVTASAFMTPGLAKVLKNDCKYEGPVETRKAVYQKLTGSWFDRQIKYEMLTYLPDLLIRQDKMSMAHSIENRVPFLDNNMVENLFGIPEKFLLTGRSPEGPRVHKYLLKKMAAKSFGHEFAFRSKMGFGIPVREFLTYKYFTEYLRDKIIPGIKSRGLFNHKVISEWVNNLKTLRYYELDALWVMVAFEIWASLYLDGNNENRNT
ncbi:MAG: asparagine synthase (glutamine-hydrolyzing) [Bacteroidales bacterium]|nr:asparagine synthase (glutamine-hydrolyzing) [Bacteroidales bacterium]